MIGTSLKIQTHNNATLNAITTDSRSCEKNDLLDAIKGEKFNGADFINEARKKHAFVVSEAANADFCVGSSQEALLKIAADYKELISPRYTIAITGSTGKTTTKDFTHALLSSVLRTHKTAGNYNNILGVSHTILTAPPKADALICEFGMNHIGEIDVLSRHIKPDISIITNIGTAHIGNLGSREMIAKAKLEIQNGMTDGKTVVLKNEPLLSTVRNPYFISSEEETSDLFFKIITKNEFGSEIFIKTRSFEQTFKTHLTSEHTLNSLLFAIAVCEIIGVQVEYIAKGLEGITENILRQRFINESGYEIYDDSYNSSPEAVIANLKMLRERKAEFSALIGDMLELGEKSNALHYYVGSECAKHSLKNLYAFGKYADELARGAIENGMSPKNVFVNRDASNPELSARQIKESYAGETLLVKASHSINAHRIIELLIRERYE